MFICKTYIPPQLHQFWDFFKDELADGKKPYTPNIRSIRLKLPELQEENTEVRRIKIEELDKEGWIDADRVLFY